MAWIISFITGITTIRITIADILEKIKNESSSPHASSIQ
jgi:hypothetical protein